MWQLLTAAAVNMPQSRRQTTQQQQCKPNWPTATSYEIGERIVAPPSSVPTHLQLLSLYVVVAMFVAYLQQPAVCHTCWRFFILA